MVYFTLPLTSRPAKGVFRALEANCSGSMVQTSSGSKIVMVGVAAQGQAALGTQTQNGGGSVGHALDDIGQLHLARVVELGEGDGQRGLQTHHTAAPG